MSLRFICALCAIVFAQTQTASAASQPKVTPFESIQTRLTLAPGQTYLSFMQTEVKPGLDAFEETIQNDPAARSKSYRQLQADLISQGAGVAIRIDADNYIFNIGYLNGSDPESDVKSGRSYGVGPLGKESDPSDLAYLTELEKYLQSEPQAAGDFAKALMLVLSNCDSSGWASLSKQGQSVATDFLAIYTAELDRHLMVNLDPKTHPWEIDLGAATFVSVFDAATGLIMQNGALVQGSLTEWWAKGQNGSGIGETRSDRIALQRLIGNAETQSDSARAIFQIIGERASNDVIQELFLYLSSPNTPADLSRGTGTNLSEHVKDFILEIQADASQIAQMQ